MTDKQLWWKTFLTTVVIILLVIFLLVMTGYIIFLLFCVPWGKWILVTVVSTTPILYYAKEKADEGQRQREYFRDKIIQDTAEIVAYRNRLEKIDSLDLSEEQRRNEISFLNHTIRYHESELKRHKEALNRWER
jgi:hypothetical protein